jgi:hypothetical protein
MIKNNFKSNNTLTDLPSSLNTSEGIPLDTLRKTRTDTSSNTSSNLPSTPNDTDGYDNDPRL